MTRKSPFRTLLVVYLLAALVGSCEYFSGSRGPMLELEVYGNPVHNFPEAMWRMYPGRADAEFQLGLGLDARAARRSLQGNRRSPQAMNEVQAGYQAAARHYHRAIEMGVKSEEKLYYHYAIALIQVHADPALTDQAIADWRRNFPYSSRSDLKRPPPADSSKITK